jgi:hypothetical protein
MKIWCWLEGGERPKAGNLADRSGHRANSDILPEDVKTVIMTVTMMTITVPHATSHLLPPKQQHAALEIEARKHITT